MRYPKLRELSEAIRAVIRGPYTTTFPRTPHTPYPGFRGQPKFDADKCVGCLACEEVCPVNAIAHKDLVDDSSRPKRILFHYTDTCIFCGQCEAACIADHQGIRLSEDWELSFFERSRALETIEKSLQLCECCGTVIACTDHLRWIAQRLGELAYSNPTLFLPKLRDLGWVDPLPETIGRTGSRGDRFKILCARCRRRTTLTTAGPSSGDEGRE